MTQKNWKLVADIGGTNARFGLVDSSDDTLVIIKKYSVSEHANFTDALKSFLSHFDNDPSWTAMPDAACLAVASIVDTELIRFTNSPWTIDRRDLKNILHSVPFSLINDFAAVGYAIPYLRPADYVELTNRASYDSYPIAVLGPGTGLGVCSLVPANSKYTVIPGEGGHVDFAPVTKKEIQILELLLARYERVSVERLLSGPGIVSIYQCCATISKTEAIHKTPAAITEGALSNDDVLATEALEIFLSVLGSTAGNLALTLGARGGVYLAGGIVPRMVERLKRSDFLHRFENKGRFQNYLETIPVRIVTKDDLGLFGAIKKLTIVE